jgi:periplasmic divalent cation tolerance protein
MTDDLCEVVITAPDPDWLAAFTHQLVEAHLCAAGHHIAPIRSIYRWQGDVHDKTEARVALHTRTTLVPEIIKRTQHEHPYEVPGIVVIPIIDGSPDYLDWIRASTKDS